MNQEHLGLRDFIEWDIANWAESIAFWKQNTSLDLEGKTALEIGGRHGGLAMWAALEGLNVVCSDLGSPSLEAEEKVKRFGLHDRITFEQISATEIPYENSFDVVYFKSVLGAVGRLDHIENQIRAITEMYKALKPGGELWFAENLAGSPLHKFTRKRFVEWGTRWRYITIQEMEEFLKPFESVKFKSVGFSAAFGRFPFLVNFMGKLDRAFLDRLVPDDWRYILVGIARKPASS